MPLRVTVWQIPGHPRSRSVCSNMVEGINAAGDRAILRNALSYRMPEGDVGLFYGLSGKLAQALRDYPARGKKAIYVDMGYWGRKDGGRFVGYHKLAVNGRHPTEYFQRREHSKERFEFFQVPLGELRPSNPGTPIIIAAMGPKGAGAEGFGYLQWETAIVAELRQHTSRPILIRPKPNVDLWREVPGAEKIDKDYPLAAQLQGAHCLIAHHSNAAVEAITMGVPAFVAQGVALAVAGSTSTLLQTIEDPPFPPDSVRRQWLADIAWTQWSVSEMHSGAAWRYLRDEGLV